MAAQSLSSAPIATYCIHPSCCIRTSIQIHPSLYGRCFRGCESTDGRSPAAASTTICIGRLRLNSHVAEILQILPSALQFTWRGVWVSSTCCRVFLQSDPQHANSNADLYNGFQCSQSVATCVDFVADLQKMSPTCKPGLNFNSLRHNGGYHAKMPDTNTDNETLCAHRTFLGTIMIWCALPRIVYPIYWSYMRIEWYVLI